jgi:hypothetical protein
VITVGIYNRYYQPVLERSLEPARAILQLTADGVYTFTSITPTPLAHTYPITATIASKHYSLPIPNPPNYPSYRRDGSTIALELCVDTSQSYTVQWLYNGIPQSAITIPSLPMPNYPIYQRTPIYPFTHNHLAGYLYDVRIVGNYQSGGMDIAIPNTHNGIITTVCIPLSITDKLFSAYRNSSGEWKIIIRNPDGSELADGTNIDVMVRVYVWSYYR